MGKGGHGDFEGTYGDSMRQQHGIMWELSMEMGEHMEKKMDERGSTIGKYGKNTGKHRGNPIEMRVYSWGNHL